MLSQQEKNKIAEEIEKVLLSLNNPEMPKEKPAFCLCVLGKDGYSEDIYPSWKHK